MKEGFGFCLWNGGICPVSMLLCRPLLGTVCCTLAVLVVRLVDFVSPVNCVSFLSVKLVSFVLSLSFVVALFL